MPGEDITLRVGGDGSEAASMFENLAGPAGLASIGTVATAAIAGVAALGAALVGLGIYGVGAADDLNKSVNKLTAQLGLNNKEAENFKNVMTDMYNAGYGDNFDDLADSLKKVSNNAVALGLDSEEMIGDVTRSALTLRDTFEYDVGDSVNAATSLINTFGLDSEEAFNLIAQGAQQGLDINGDMLDLINEYSPQFKSLGLSAEEMFDMLKSGVDDGVFSLDALADGVKEFNLKAIDGSKTTVAAFKGIGMNADEMAKKFAAGGETANKAFFQTVEAIKKIKDPIKQNEVAVGLFGTKFEDLESGMLDTLTNMRGGFDKTKGTIEEINKVKYNDLGFQLEQLKRNFETSIAIPIGQFIIPIIGRALSAFKKVSSYLQTALGPVLGEMKNHIIESFSGTMPNIQSFMSYIITKVPAIISLFRDQLVPVWKNYISSIAETARTFMSTFVPLVINIIKSEGPNIITQIKNVATTIGNLMQTISKFVSSPGFKLAVANFAKMAAGAVKAVVKIIKYTIMVYNAVYTMANKVIGFMTIFGNAWAAGYNRVRNAVNNMRSSASSLLSSIQSRFNSIRSSVSSSVSRIYNDIRSKFNLAKAAAIAAVGYLYNAVNSKINSIKRIFTSLGTSISKTLNGLKSSAYKWGSNLMSQFYDGVMSKVNKIKNAVKDVAGTVKRYIGWSSPTEDGPGKDSHKWAPNLMNMLIKGFEKFKPKMQSTMSKIAETTNITKYEPSKTYSPASTFDSYQPSTANGANMYIDINEPNIYDERGMDILFNRFVTKLERYGYKPQRR